jgi:hypothetical protein
VDADKVTVHYDPGHPWYYIKRGNGRAPLPVAQIKPASDASCEISLRLPSDRRKRTAKLRHMVKAERAQLQADRQRYVELVERGAAALNQFDRSMAHGEDEELAWASAVALKYSHIANGLARIESFERQLVHLSPDPPAKDSSPIRGRHD